MLVFFPHRFFVLYRSDFFQVEMFLGITVLQVVLLFLLMQIILPFHCHNECGEDEEM